MSGRLFVDTNVFLYTVEERDVRKSQQASAWIRYLSVSGRGVANLQVMNEISNVLLKREVMSPHEIFTLIDRWAAFGSTAVSEDTVLAARVVRFETGYSWWDCILLASAIELGCVNFLSEDLRDGHSIRGLTIISPFLHSPPQLPIH